MGRRTPTTSATLELVRLGIPFATHTYAHDPRAGSFGLEAAAALGLEPGRVLKTLLALVEGGFAIAVLPVDRSLDLRLLAAALGGKRAVLAEPGAAERRTGQVVGGISPVGQRTPSPLVLDDSALQYSSVLVSSGRRGFELELTPADLLRATGGRTASIAR